MKKKNKRNAPQRSTKASRKAARDKRKARAYYSQALTQAAWAVDEALNVKRTVAAYLKQSAALIEKLSDRLYIVEDELGLTLAEDEEG